MELTIVKKEDYDFAHQFYEEVDRADPISEDEYISYVDQLVENITPGLSEIGRVSVDGKGCKAEPDFHISTFSDPGRSFVMVGPSEFGLIWKAFEVIESFISNQKLEFLCVFDCATYFCIDNSGIRFAYDDTDGPEALIEAWNIPRELCSLDSTQIRDTPKD